MDGHFTRIVRVVFGLEFSPGTKETSKMQSQKTTISTHLEEFSAKNTQLATVSTLQFALMATSSVLNFPTHHCSVKMLFCAEPTI